LAGKKLLYEGTAKKIYLTDSEDKIVQEFKDDITSAKEPKNSKLKNKGKINNILSSLIFEYLESHNIMTHYISRLSDREMLVKKLDIIPVKIVVRNICRGDFCKKYGLEENTVLSYPVTEYYLKNKKLKNPMLSESHIIAFHFASKEEIKSITKSISKINAVLKSFLERRQLKLIDLSMEFGRFKGKILLGDELSMENCRFIDLENDDLGISNKKQDLTKVYQYYYNRIVGENQKV